MLQHSQQQQPNEHLVSTLLMSFLERKVSPQTIADVVRTQILESQIAPSAIDILTANGIIESLTESQGITDCIDILFFVTRHLEFPAKLTSKAAVFGLDYALKRRESFLNHLDVNTRRDYLTLLDCFTIKVVEIFLTRKTEIPVQDWQRLENIFKNGDINLNRLCSASTQLSQLQKSFAQSPKIRGEPLAKFLPILKQNPSQCAEDILKKILSEPDHSLAVKGIQHFRLPSECIKDGWKLFHIGLCISSLENSAFTPFQVSFLCEWFFEGQLKAAMLNSEFQNKFLQNIARIVDEKGKDVSVLKGVLRAIQRDLSLTAADSQTAVEVNPAFKKSLTLAQTFIFQLVNVVKTDLVFFTRHFATWSLQIPVHPFESRLLTRGEWQWVRALAGNGFEEDMRAAPAWVVKNSSRFAAQIFQIASSFWLQNFAYTLLEGLYAETLSPSFEPKAHHVKYVEFLIRTLRKKTPIYVSRPETLYALRLIGKAQTHEEQQLILAETRIKMTTQNDNLKNRDKDFLGELMSQEHALKTATINSVAAALSILVRIARASSRNAHFTNLEAGII